MPPPKKAAKKVAAKHASDGDTAKDMRRAYEHLGRVGTLHALLEKHAAMEITNLTKLAQKELTVGNLKDAADLLRAAEHLSFGALGSPERNAHVDPKLVDAVANEFNHKLQKAKEHWSREEQHHSAVEDIYTAVLDRARKAFSEGAYRQALELGRGAEALAHVHISGDKQFSAGTKQQKLTD